MSVNAKNKNAKEKTLFELCKDLRKDEVAYLRFVIVSIILEFLIILPLFNLIGVSCFEPYIQYICLISIIMLLAWLCSLNWITLKCIIVPHWFYFISFFASIFIVFSIIIIVC